MSRNATHPSGVSIARKLKELYPSIYNELLCIVRNENLEFNRQYAKEKVKTIEYRKQKASYMREYYQKNRERILARGKAYRIKSDYDAHRKLKGKKDENKVKQAEVAD